MADDKQNTATATEDDFAEIPKEDLAYLTPEEREAYEAAFGPSAEEQEQQRLEQERLAEEQRKQQEDEAERQRAEQEAAQQALQQAQQEESNVAEITRQLEALQAKQTELREQLSSGEIDDDAFFASLEEVQSEQGELIGKKAKAEAILETRQREEERRQQAIQAEFTNASNAFLGQHKYLLEDAHFDGFNQVLGDLSLTPHGAQLSHEDLLAAALEEYRPKARNAGAPLPELGASADEEKEDGADDGKKATAPTEPRKDARPVPPTVNQLPSEQLNPHVSKVAELAARLDASEGLERERIIAALPDNLVDEVLSYAD